MGEQVVRAIRAEETRGLRGMILRPGQTPKQLIYPGDDQPDTLHAGAFQGDALVGIATVARNACAGHEFAAPWQLRGMATTPEVQGQGYGRALIDACLAHVAANGGYTLWCNGRTSAAGFYTRLGFTAVGAEFVTDTGPHFVFFRPVTGQ